MLYFVLLQAVLLFFAPSSDVAVTSPSMDPGVREDDTVEIIVVYDNYAWKEGLETTWGFACVISGLEKTVLFDTGGDGKILLSNMRALGIDPKEIDIVVLSHYHRDHTGGLEAFLEINSDASVFVPATFPDSFKSWITRAGGAVVEVSESKEILTGLFSVGVLGRAIPEQGIFLKAKEGLVVITGCAHPGIADIVAKAKEIGGRAPYLVIGGFHLIQTGKTEAKGIIDRIRGLGTSRVLPTHCTGDAARELFREAFTDGYVDGGLGTKMKITPQP